MNSAKNNLPSDWEAFLGLPAQGGNFNAIMTRVRDEYRQTEVYPAYRSIFEAFRLCSPDKVRVVILGQDPYHGEGEAHGLAFSVPNGVKIPPSLRNIFKEIKEECGASFSGNGDLSSWAEQGVLLLNSSLTVRANKAGSHRFIGWEVFTDHVVSMLSIGRRGLVFMLWGSHARAKGSLIDGSHHLVMTAPHPSPLSAYQGFFGCGHFKKANEYLAEQGLLPISWSII